MIQKHRAVSGNKLDPNADAFDSAPKEFVEMRRRFNDRTARIGVIGLGYVGLPLALAYSKAGFHVTGIDMSLGKVESLRAGKSPLATVDEGLVRAMTRAGRFDAAFSLEQAGDLDVVIICVPTPVEDGEPDLSAVVRATEAIAFNLRPGMFTILESTVYPGTTEEELLPRLAASGLTPDEDFFLGMSPERMNPGSDWDVTQIPKLVSGIGSYSAELMRILYETILETVVTVSSTRVAEMTKLLENSFRNVNVGLVNEMAKVAHRLGIDIWEVIAAASTKPFGFMPFQPGPGLGGHCIPVDPLYLVWKAEQHGEQMPLLSNSQSVNESMPSYVAARIDGLLDGVAGKRLLLIGVAFKKDVDDARNSPSAEVAEMLDSMGAQVRYHDPHVPELMIGNRLHKSVADLETELEQAECVVILTDHSDYSWPLIAQRSRLVFDCRNALGGMSSEHIYKL
jgi:UDP-N-acetyl-D-glucosamine dehydrogenase